jgi:hypothetical protein
MVHVPKRLPSLKAENNAKLLVRELAKTVIASLLQRSKCPARADREPPDARA